MLKVKSEKFTKSILGKIKLFVLIFLVLIAGGIFFPPESYYDQGNFFSIVTEAANGVGSVPEPNDADIQLLARAINGEARGEPYKGQVAVGAVILNRVRSPLFPKTIAGVIYQPGAFTAVSDGQINKPIDPDSTVYKAAKDAMNGWDPTNGCLYYWNPATATSKWIWSREIHAKIGKHYFGK